MIDDCEYFNPISTSFHDQQNVLTAKNEKVEEESLNSTRARLLNFQT